MGNSFQYDNHLIKAYTELINWTDSSTVIFCVLGQVSPTLSNKQTWATYNDIKWAASTPYEIAAVGGSSYSLGGGVCTNTTPALVTDTVNFGISAKVFTAASGYTITATMCTLQYAVSSSTSISNPLLSNHDLGGTQAVSNGTLTLTWPSNIAFSITSSAAA
jgi:hypothetical protein